MSWVNRGAVSSRGAAHTRKVRNTTRALIRAWLVPAPTNGPMSSHATTRQPTPMSTSEEEACSILPMNAPPGRSNQGLSTTGSAPPPSPPRPIRSVPTAPNQRKSANRLSSTTDARTPSSEIPARCSAAEREPGAPNRGRASTSVDGRVVSGMWRAGVTSRILRPGRSQSGNALRHAGDPPQRKYFGNTSVV